MGLVGMLASNFGNVPGGLNTTGPAVLWLSFSPRGGSYSFSSFPPVAVPDAWLLCPGQGDSSVIPSGVQVGAG